MALLLDDEPEVRDPPRAPRGRPAGRRRRRRTLRVLAVLVAVALAGAAALTALPGVLPDLDPFERETIDRSPPVLLRSLEDLSQYRAATANLQVPIQLEEDVEILPSWLAGEKVLFVASGTADASVDFRGLGPAALTVSADRRAVTVRVPRAVLSPARLDLERSRVFDRERGLLDRLGDVVAQDPDQDRQLFALAQRRLTEAARADPNLPAAAERNTRAMLERLLRGLGFQRVDVRFG